MNGTRLAAGRSGAGVCAFFEAEGGRLCAIHRVAGKPLLPSACRNFPRVALRDARGVFVTLSHYCPTAARLLLDAGDLAVVEASPELSLDGAVEGLDATDVMPPLLRPGMLTDHDGYDVWEREAIAVLNDREHTPPAALSIIRRATTDASFWNPGGEPLAGAVRTNFARAASVRDRPPRRPGRLEHATKAFLSAHLFANWAAYEQGGLLAVCDQLDHALARLGSPADEKAFVDAARRADLEVRHRVNSQLPTSNVQLPSRDVRPHRAKVAASG